MSQAAEEEQVERLLEQLRGEKRAGRWWHLGVWATGGLIVFAGRFLSVCRLELPPCEEGEDPLPLSFDGFSREPQGRQLEGTVGHRSHRCDVVMGPTQEL
jgi:hypothetical protein